MEFASLIAELGNRLHVRGDIEVDDENRCLMEFDGMGVVIQGDDELRTLSLLAPLCDPPPERLEELYRTLLEANHLFAGTFGATLSIDPGRGWVHLCKNLPYAALDAEVLASELENFMNAVERWSSEVKGFRAHEDSAEGGDRNAEEKPMDDAFLRV